MEKYQDCKQATTDHERVACYELHVKAESNNAPPAAILYLKVIYRACMFVPIQLNTSS